MLAERSIQTRVLLAVALIAVAAGVCLRLTNLGQKLYWFDECYTSLKLSGASERSVHAQLFDGRITTFAEVADIQRLNPAKGWIDTLRSCAGIDPQVAPMHCLILRLWAVGFGDSPAILRSFSALVGVLCLPAIFWLLMEMSGRLPTSAVGAALLAVSPFQIVYAQEAREYALWTLLVILTTAALVRALRTDRRIVWAIYSALMVIGFYTHLLHATVLLVHAGAVWASTRPTTSTIARFPRGFVLSAVWACAALLPWLLLVVWQSRVAYNKIAWTTEPIDRAEYIYWVLRNFASPIVEPGTALPPALAASVRIAALLAVGAAVFLIGRSRTRGATGWLIVLFVLMPVALLGAPDLTLGGRRLMIVRYFAPTCLGMTLAMSWVLGSAIEATAIRRRSIGWLGLFVLLLAGLASSLLIVHAADWSNKRASAHNRAFAPFIESAANPLVVVDPVNMNFGNVLSLSHLIDRSTGLVSMPGPECDLASFDRIFVYNPGEGFLKSVQARTGRTAAPVSRESRTALYELR